MDAAHRCVYCRQESVAITREQGECRVGCGGCGRRWSYPNMALTDETALNSFGMYAVGGADGAEPGGA